MKYYIKTHLLAVVTILLTGQIVNAQNNLSGRVTDSDGTPLQGVNISVDNSSIKTTTDSEGHFNIDSENMPLTLTFEREGYASMERTFVQPQSKVAVDMQKDLLYQKVAYGKRKKDHITSSISTISGEELVKSRSSNLLIALQQRLPGLRIIQNDGTPGGETFSSHIRGFDSPNSNRILFLVDGIERDPAVIDPHEVESVSVLKDAAATSMYGMRGSGGIVLINTKEGFNGTSRINVSIDQAMQAPTRLPEFTSAYDYARLYNQGLANDTLFSGQSVGGDQFYSENEIERYRLADSTALYPVRNMVDDFTKDYSSMTRINLSFQGGTDIMQYFTSVSYMNQGGVFQNTPFDRYSYDAESKSNRFNFRTNMDLQINETIDAWAKIGGYIEKNNGPAGGIGNIIAKLYETPNNAHNDLTPDGEVLVERDRLNYRTNESVFGLLNRTGSSDETVSRLNNTFGGRKNLDTIVKGLSAQAQLSFDILSRNRVIRQRNYAAYEISTVTTSSGMDSLAYVKVPGTNNTNLSDGQIEFFNYSYNARASIDFARIFNDRHEVTAKVMGERNFQQKQALVPKNYVGLAGRATYAYDDRYLLEANFSYQGSEQFAPGNRYGFFPSVSLGWIVSNEAFLQNSESISFLKLRVSAGQTGNDVFNYGENNQYLYISTWNNNATQDQIGNPNIQWETITKYNLGLETEFYSKLSFGVELFYHDTDDVIIRDISIIPDGMMGLGGASLPPANVGTAKNKGFEIYAGYNNQFSEDAGLNINGSVSYSTSENTYAAELPFDENYAYEFRRQGYPIGQRWGYQTAGLFNSQEEIDNWADQSSFGGEPIPGDIKYVDLTGDGIVNEKDLAPIAGNDMPNLLLGFSTSARFKNVDLSVFINGSFQRDVFLHGFGRWYNRDNITEYMKDEAWTPERASSGDAMNFPRLGTNSPNYTMNSFWIEDGSYIRVRNVELGYTLPQAITRKVNIENVRLFVNGLNLLTWDNLPNVDFDPETSNGGNINHPIFKAYNFGININF